MGNLGKHLSSGKSHRKPSDGGSYPLQYKVSMVRCLDVLWMVGIGLARLKKLSTCPNQPSRLHPNTACPISAPSLCTRKFSFAAGAGLRHARHSWAPGLSCSFVHRRWSPFLSDWQLLEYIHTSILDMVFIAFHAAIIQPQRGFETNMAQ